MRLNQYHYFRYRHRCYIYNVNEGNAFRIDPDLGRIIGQIKSKYPGLESEMPGDVVTMMKQMHLIGQEEFMTKPENINTRVSALSLNVAQSCNMRCRYCYGNDGSYGKNGLMTTKTALRAVDWLLETSGDRKNLALVFFGGEPLLNFPLISQTVHHALQNGRLAGKEFHFSITTNGTLFRKEIIQFLNKHNFSVTISYDGDRIMQNVNRPLASGSGSFKTVNRGMKRFLRSRKGDAIARATITSGFIDLGVIRRNLKKAGFKKIFYSPISTAPSNLFDLSEIEHTRICSDLELQAEELVRCLREKKPIAETVIPDMINLLHSVVAKIRFCGAGCNFLAISADGKIYPCHRFVGQKEWELGDLFRFDNGLCREFIGSGVDSRPVCSKCWARYMCGGGCWHHNQVRTGSVIHPDRRQCRQIKKCIELAIYVAEKLNDEHED